VVDVDVDASAPTGSTAAAAGPGLAAWVEDGEWRDTQAEIVSGECIEGTDRPRTGVLFAYADVVAGTPPSGVMNPTVDLQLRLFSAPRRGTIRFHARTLRLGHRLYVGEVEMWHPGDESPFGLAVSTFVNRPIPFPDREGPFRRNSGDVSGIRRSRMTYTPPIGPERVGPGCFDLEVDLKTPQGTVAGATLGLFSELAAVDLFSDAHVAVVDELDVRFLNKVKVGPIRASASVFGARDGATTVRVEIADRGDGDRLVTYALAVCRELVPT
jgi:acyl-coenzyme A thioesterase PaaI-like protein